MGREVKRVPLDFDWPIAKVWAGFLMPDEYDEIKCTACDGSGSSERGRYLHDLWYGYVPFKPSDTGCPELTIETPEVRAFAERNSAADAAYYGTSESAIRREAQRLADLWNKMWSHHLTQEDVDALVEAGRLKDFTHTWTREEGWQPRDPNPVVTAAQVNSWSIGGFGHDAINSWVVCCARLERECVEPKCSECNGDGHFERYPGQRAEAEAWEATDPPEGEGWQLWETVSEGSPISPVFPDAAGLAAWMSSPAYHWGSSRPLTREQADAFVSSGWAPTLIYTSTTGLVPGEQLSHG